MSNKKNKIKIILGVISTILLGLIVAALWEIVGHPILNFCSSIVIKIITLGQTTLLDYIYKDIGRGFSEHYSIGSYFMANFIIMIIIMGSLFILRIITRSYLSKSHKEQEKILEDHDKKLSTLNKVIFYVILSIMFFSIILFGDLIVASYKDKIRTHFNQCVIICTPYITEKEKNLLLSEFALIKSKADYISLNNKIKGIAQQYGLDLPEFSPL